MSEWVEVTLNDVGSLQRGKSKHRPRYAYHLYGGPYPFVQTGQIKSARKYIREYEQTYSEAGLKQSKLWKKGTLCITIAANIAEIGILDFDACFPDSVIGFVPDESKADLDFIYYLLQHFQRELKHRGEGSVQDNTNLGTFRDISFPIPDLKEQKNISAVLASLDDKIDLLHRQNKTLEALAQTLFRHWFIDGVDDDWEIGTLGDLGKVVTGKTPSTKTKEYWGREIEFVTPTDFKNFGKYIGDTSRCLSKSGKEKVRKSIVPPNSVLVTCIGSDMGKIAMSTKECVTNQQINSLIADDHQRFSEYAYQYLKSIYPLLRSMALGGTTMPIINKTDFSNIEIPIPPDETLIVFNTVTSSFNEKIINNAKQIRTLEQLRDTLLPKLMSGAVRVRQN